MEDIAELIAKLRHPNEAMRRYAASALGETRAIGKDARGIPALVDALQDPNRDVGRAAAESLIKIGPLAVPALIQTLEARGNDRRLSDIARQFAARVLGKIGDRRAVPALMEALQAPSKYVRHYAAWALGTLADRQAVPALMTALRNEDQDLRRYAAKSLGEIGDRQAALALIVALQDEDGGARQYAAEALGKIRDTRAVPALTATLRDEDSGARRYAAWALGNIGDARAVPALTATLWDKDGDAQKYAAGALGNLAAALPDPVPALRTALPRLRRLRNRDPIFRDALEQIEAVTARLKSLPLPADAPPPDSATLPRPADAPATTDS